MTKLRRKDASLTKPEFKDVETSTVKSGDDNADVYTWSHEDYKRTKFGDVVDSPNSPPDQDGVTGVINGNEYNFTLEVELDEGRSKNKLG